MQENELKKILTELYQIDSELKSHENDLIAIINRMHNIRPDTKFDAAFAARLKVELLSLNQRESNQEKPKPSFNFNFMNKKIYIAAGSLAVIALAIFLSSKSFQGKQSDNFLNLASNNREVNEEPIKVLPAGAFGSLVAVASSGMTGESTKSSVAPLGMGAGMGGDAVVSRMVATDAPVGSTMIAPIEGKIMPPMFGIKYQYTGDPITLDKETASVYRRVKGTGSISRELADSLKSFGFSELSLNSFTNLKVTNFSMVEDKDLGLMVSFDFLEDSIYVSENWEKWRNLERESCGADEACWKRFEIKIEDVPADSELIAISDRFLADHQVSLEHYGEPIVDNQWRQTYESFADKTNFYIPEYASVIYPLEIDGQVVRDQSGGYAGLRVNVNVSRKAASGLSGLTPFRYESSDYGLETSSETIIKQAENGGWNGNYYIQAENQKTVELGTPERAYVQIWKYNNNRNEELLVPSLIFPVKNAENLTGYYGQRFVIVPLVKEILTDLNNQPTPLMYRTLDGAGLAGSTGAAEPATEPMEIAPIAPAVIPEIAPLSR